MVFLDKPRVYNKKEANWYDMFHYENDINDNESLFQYLKSVNLNLPFIIKEETFEKKLVQCAMLLFDVFNCIPCIS